MKKILIRSFLAIVFTIYCSYQYAQSLPNIDLVPLDHANDYKKAEPFVLQSVTYILSIPYKKDNAEVNKSLQFISKWMRGTPDFSFVIDGTAAKITKNNNELLVIYLASMVKYSLENRTAAKDPKLVKLNSMSLMLDYCQNTNNNIKMNKQLLKLAEAREKGELEQYL